MTDGGPAFPNTQQSNVEILCACGKYVTFHDVRHPGMSLRDWFAGMALQGLLSNSDATKGVDENQIAGAAYLHADAMIRCREDTT